MKRPISKKKLYLMIGIIILAGIIIAGYVILRKPEIYRPITQKFINLVKKKPETQKVEAEFMFVQTATSGSLTPVKDEENTYNLTLKGVAPHTTYFSDQPKRAAGLAQTNDFLKGFCWNKDNPPNAAIVISGAPEDKDVMVVELTEPIYDATKNTLGYKVKAIKEQGGGTEGFYQWFISRQDEKFPQSFGNVALFIDSCPDQMVACVRNLVLADVITTGCCWHFPTCLLCHSGNLSDVCTDQSLKCQDGKCTGCAFNLWATRQICNSYPPVCGVD